MQGFGGKKELKRLSRLRYAGRQGLKLHAFQGRHTLRWNGVVHDKSRFGSLLCQVVKGLPKRIGCKVRRYPKPAEEGRQGRVKALLLQA